MSCPETNPTQPDLSRYTRVCDNEYVSLFFFFLLLLVLLLVSIFFILKNQIYLHFNFAIAIEISCELCCSLKAVYSPNERLERADHILDLQS